MSARTLILTFLGLALIGSLAAAADQASQREPLRPFAACMDPRQVRGWSQIDEGELLVDAGRSRYHITLDTHCGDLGFSTGIRFESKGVGGGGRICGDLGDSVVPLGTSSRSLPCSIGRIKPVSKEEYNALLQGRGKSGGERAGGTPDES